MINTYVYNDTDEMRELFCLVGKWLVSKEVHETLGLAITSETDDIWNVSIGPNKSADGFVQMRKFDNSHMHIRYLYSEKQSVKSALLKSALDTAKQLGSTLIWTNDKRTETIWKSNGFKEHAIKHRGLFSKFERSLI